MSRITISRDTTKKWLAALNFAVLGLSFLMAVILLVTLPGPTRDARASRQWPTTDGTITYVGTNRIHTRHGPTYYLVVNYTYTVDDTEYRGYRVTPETRSSSFGDLPELREYAPGDVVPVYYKTWEPAECLLKPGMSPNLRNGWIMCAVCWAVFFCCFRIYRRLGERIDTDINNVPPWTRRQIW